MPGAHTRDCLLPTHLAPNDSHGLRRLLLDPPLVKRGCVPVIIQPSVLQPYDDTLPYANFSLRTHRGPRNP